MGDPVSHAISHVGSLGVSAAQKTGELLSDVTGLTREKEKMEASRRASAKAAKQERRLQNIRAARERRQAVRQARIARAQIQSQAVAGGVQGSSSAAGGAAGVTQQLASNLSFLGQTQALTNKQSIFQQQAADFAGKAQDIRSTRSTVFQVAGTAASVFGALG